MMKRSYIVNWFKERKCKNKHMLCSNYNLKSKQNGNVEARCIVPTRDIR